MKTTFLLLFILVQTSVFAQFNCRMTKQSDGSEVKKCYHQNGQISIIETWDTGKKDGNLKVFNNQGKEVCSYNLRHYGGHASALLAWYPNGQVKSVSYSDAPDGGIQYYHSTRQFDEVGNQTSFTEDSYDNKLRIQIPSEWDTVKPRKPLVEISQVLEKPKSKEKRVDFLIVNKTKSAQRVTLNYSIDIHDTILRIASKQEVCHMVFHGDVEQKLNDLPELELLGTTKRFEVLRGKEEELEDHRVIVWEIVSK